MTDTGRILPSAAGSHPVCIVCGNLYPQFDARVPAVGGGMEIRAALFGRGLAALGCWPISFVVSDFGQDFITRHEGIDFHIYQPIYRRAGRNVFPRLRRHRRFPTLHFDRRDLALLWQIPLIATWLTVPALFFPRFWRTLAPDVVCCFGNNERSAEVIADCRHAGIRTVLCIASDKDLSPDYRPGNREPNHYGMPKWLGHYSLTHADLIVAQTENQQVALQRHFDRAAVLIRNPVHVFPDDPRDWLPRGQREFVLWIGRTDDFNKRPLLFLQLARECPDLQFVMIASRTDDAIFHSLERACPANLRILEHLPPQDIRDYLRRARILVNTSKFEGFPNTFLQAATTGTPIVSLEVDPDGMLLGQGCGICADGTIGSLRTALISLCHDSEMAESFAVACHRYVLARHAAEGRIAEFAACLEEQRRIAATSHKTARFPGLFSGLKRFA